ncbi:uncharacterized protein LOC129573087 [Sitodiplosis mosellana]|uniref:uncharacterized protein LOC129573087 n=1 Tax=Sitodiplosis mosellana TaxID=263140 RepID=UPI002443EB6C|nr:uncharacterized protein LOC129573087 [Sitodiplosis mosellana]
MSSLKSISQLRSLPVKRFFSQKSPSASKPKKNNEINANVPGLSSYVIKQKSEPLGPGASSTGIYKVPEYFSYDRFSYHGAEIELSRYRLEQPSATKGKK